MDDPSIVKLLENEWQDETMHSREEVEAFQAALSRGIGGDSGTPSQPFEPNPKILTLRGDYHATTQMEASGQTGNTNSQVQSSKHEQNAFDKRVKQKPSNAESKQLHGDVILSQQLQSQDDQKYEQADEVPSQIPHMARVPRAESVPTLNDESDRMLNQDSESQYLKLQKMSNQQATILDRASNQINRVGGKQVPFAVLLPVLLPQLDKDRAIQLQTLFNKLKKNEITKDDFVRLLRNIVGDQMLRLAVSKVHFQSATNHFQLEPPSAAQQLPPRTVPLSIGAPDFTDRQPSAQFHQKGVNSSATSNLHLSATSNLHLSAAQGKPDTGYVKIEDNEQSSQEVERQSTRGGLSSSISGTKNQGRGQSSLTSQELEKPLQQQLPIQQKHFSIYGAGSSTGNYHPSLGTSITTSASSFKPSSVELQIKQVPQHRSISAQLAGNLSGTDMGNGTAGTIKDESFEKQPSKMGFPTSIGGPSTSGTVFSSNTISTNANSQIDSNALGARIPSTAVASGVNRTPPKKPSIGRKKPLETDGASPPSSSKKQKVTGAFLDQSIEHLNDVTAVSGVNIREEEEQLFSGVKEDIRVSEASRRIAQEEEERLILQKTPLQKKLSEIMIKCGLKGISNDVERCISLCVEERMRVLISNLIRLSKQRTDAEKSRHITFVTSDVRRQIMMMNWKVKEGWEKKQAEVEKLRKLNETEDSSGRAAEKEKDDGRTKLVKVNRDEDDKMRTAANVAARAAVGGDDMLSKWQLIAEQARQKREGGSYGHGVAPSSQPVKDVARKPVSILRRRDNQEEEKKGDGSHVSPSGPIIKFGRNQVGAPRDQVSPSISVRDVIAVLESEGQMSTSTLIYRLYDKVRPDAVTE